MSSSESILLNNPEKKEHLKSLYQHLCANQMKQRNAQAQKVLKMSMIYFFIIKDAVFIKLEREENYEPLF
ncbi:hypothetical protein BpHYR1_003923 [Brachionus plicatilis]|uniref:Uncharacterized protein n=1 Tax=Brachionus plicatilis TaxID=10195 RepID=A0A3M7REM4_BRAPC|nr:hypothetical protein BpHYR1_003923 [Brachionus plicatilis]